MEQPVDRAGEEPEAPGVERHLLVAEHDEQLHQPGHRRRVLSRLARARLERLQHPLARLAEHATDGHQAVPASPATGVNTLTGEGLSQVLSGADVVVDVSNSPSFEDTAVLEFFETSARNILDAEAGAGVGYHVALSVVGAERQADGGYMRAKIAQEKLIKNSSIPYTIVRATQFFEFVARIADSFTEGSKVRVPPVRFQPMAADDVASAVATVAMGSPLNGIVEIAGPEQFRFDELIRLGLSARKDPREVIADPHARYFGTELGERSLVPGDDAQLGETRFEAWLSHATKQAANAGRQPA